MPLFNSSILTGSQEGDHAIIQFGSQGDASGAGVQPTIFRSYADGPGQATVRVTSLPDFGANAALYDPKGYVPSIQMNWVQVQSGPNFIWELVSMWMNLNGSGPWRVTLTKQYSGYAANTRHVYLSTVSSGTLVSNVMDLYFESGYNDSAGDREITPLQTSAEFTGSKITVALQKHYIAFPTANCSGTCRFKLEKL